MTTPADPSEFMDTGNKLLQPSPARIDAGSVNLPDGTVLGVVTFRTPSTTLSIFLSPEEVGQWGEILTEAANALGGKKKKLAVATPGDAALLKQAMKGG